MHAMLMRRYAAFAKSNSSHVPPASDVEHAIHFTDPQPVKSVPYRQSPAHAAYADEQVAGLIKAGFIVPSASPWSSPIVIVPKAGGDLRMCIDYRKLNARTKKDAYPMPLIEDCLHLLRDADFITMIDIQEAFYHILMAKGSREATAFSTSHGLYHWTVMPFGLCNAPATFQRHVDEVLRKYIRKTCAAFFDDIAVYTKA